ncbi:hypothetical protein Patl1_25504 [Pistacia atlantica]|uniref:Uncharacterized protein n=1 Tax=Pistacia atlantica TaxID=434234 RepID=A0ACC1B1U3_9ROSI|nr:hypothetical protein Patl1_25504 [Pistacia atlantica]
MNRHDVINTCLPDESIMEIFRHLDSETSRDACSLVCKRWHELERLSRTFLRLSTLDSSNHFSELARCFVNVKSIYIDGKPSRNSPRSLSDDVLALLADSFSKLENLTLAFCPGIDDSGLISVAHKCMHLKSLVLEAVGKLVKMGCSVGDYAIAALGKCCKQLEDLTLCSCKELTDEGLADLTLGCGKSLKSLSVALCVNITDLSLEAVGSHCKSLETLSLDSDSIHDKGVLAVARGCPLLKVLKLQCVNVTDEALIAVGTHCLSLELLELNTFRRFTDKSLCAIGNGCKRLKNLSLSDCPFLTDLGLEAIAAGCKELTNLEIYCCQDIGTVGLESIGQSCRCLTNLAVFQCPLIGNRAFLEVGRGCEFLQALLLVECSVINDDAICGIARGCQNLKKLQICRCDEIGNKGLTAVGEYCKSLTDLRVELCDRVGDEGLIAVGEGCSLRFLSVSGCHEVGDAGIIAIARGSSQLQQLSITGLAANVSMAEIGEGCPLLKNLVLRRCAQITDAGLGQLVRNCTGLESCYLVRCPRITAVGVASVVTCCANIRKIMVESGKVSERTKRRAASSNSSRKIEWIYCPY